MKLKRVFLYINGILTRPGESDNWNGRAVTWTHLHTDFLAEKVEYYVGPISRAFGRGQRRRAEKLAKTIRYYANQGWQVVLVAHSNGANVVANAVPLLAQNHRDAVESVHLVAAACPADFRENGLNALGAPVTVWEAGNDKALKMAKTVGWLVGFGTLGLDGPKNAKVPTTTIRFEDYGHSTFFGPTTFDSFMIRVTNRFA